MNKQEAQKKYDEVQAELVKLKAIIDAPDKAESWPQAGDSFYVLSDDGCVSRDTFYGCRFLLRKLAMGSVFRTKAEAEAARDKQFATVRVQNKLKELQGDWVADWSDSEQNKYYIVYNHERQCLVVDASGMYQRHNLYSTDAAWIRVKDNMEADVKLMLGVE